MRSFLNRFNAPSKYHDSEINTSQQTKLKLFKINKQHNLNNLTHVPTLLARERRRNSSTTASERENFIADRYQVGKKLGEGSFGFVRLATDTKTGKEVAIKFEHKKDVKKHLLTESKVYKDVQATGFVNMYWFGRHGDHTVLVMTKLGLSLRELYSKCNRIFTVSTCALIAIQVLERLEVLHDSGWLHQDIKPENIVVGGVNDSHTIYLIDYGTSSRYIGSKSHQHREKLLSGRIVGTARYSSVTNHYGYYQSRKDDLQSFGYTLIYWLLGKLPWQKITDKDFRVKWGKVGKMKKMMTNSELCRGTPAQFEAYMNYVSNLQYKERPNYTHLRNLFRTLVKSEGNKKSFMWERLGIKLH